MHGPVFQAPPPLSAPSLNHIIIYSRLNRSRDDRTVEMKDAPIYRQVNMKGAFYNTQKGIASKIW
jgi:hypothetical protein